MAQLTDRVLQYLNDSGSADTLKLADEWKEDHQKIIGAVKSLQSLGAVIEAEQLSRTKTELTAEGKSFVELGSHEAIVYNTVPPGDDGMLQPEMMAKAGAAAKIGMSKAMQNGWIKIVKNPGGNKVVRSIDSIEDKVRERLQIIADGNADSLDTAALAELKKRKLLVQTPVNYYNIKRGAEFTVSVVKLETELTPEMLASGEWRQKKFKAYNFKALGASLNSGHLHPLMKVRSEFRSILLEMGFSEMPTNRFVESSFWNFDALYVPQKHPARDAQDTFFMSQPVKCTSVPEDFMAKVRAAHTGSDYGTLGYGPVWKEEESYKNCMRTHTTAVSARMLHAIGSKPDFKPSKLFSIDRVFRNETLDATHLAEFHQVEGVVADYNINLGNLIGIMKEFFGRLGITKLRFKPAYNPYTEPSMEVFSYHEGLKKWVEIGNSGMFRPEMLLPMGIPKDVRVIAWGLSLERPTMIRYGIDNIRDLVGPRGDLQMVYNNPICRLDKNFTIDTDGSYLDNPLLKSPKRGKNPTAARGPLGDQDVSKKSKNRKRKKKAKAPSENSVPTNIENPPSASADPDNKSSQEKTLPLSSSQPQAQTAKPKKTRKPKKSGSGGESAEIKTAEKPPVVVPNLPPPTPKTDSVTNVASPTDNAPPASAKSSKKKKKPKVKVADSPS